MERQIDTQKDRQISRQVEHDDGDEAEKGDPHLSGMGDKAMEKKKKKKEKKKEKRNEKKKEKKYKKKLRRGDEIER